MLSLPSLSAPMSAGWVFFLLDGLPVAQQQEIKRPTLANAATTDPALQSCDFKATAVARKLMLATIPLAGGVLRLSAKRWRAKPER